jgi:DNA topoisomerase I
MASNLLIVESPSKAKTLKKYLGRDFEVVASYGHVRDLVPKQGAVDTDHDFAMKYQLVERNKKHVDAIARAVKESDAIYLATDPDREGEAIAWHLEQILTDKRLLKNKQVHRVVFYEITQNAVKAAVANPRDISMPLVNAQQARRALDYLVGFNLSPLLWKKIRRGLSAGRVQSPALRLIAEREAQIAAFVSEEYWSIHLDSHKAGDAFSAKLTQFGGEKLTQFSVRDDARQKEIVAFLEKHAHGQARVALLEKKRKQRQAAAPFTTSTLQQEAVRKLGMSTERAMRIAQQLYEGVDIGQGSVGLISYMRTDSVNLSNEALADIRDHIARNYAEDYLPKAPVEYANKSKNAQEAHEAIRPTSIGRTPQTLKDYLSAEQFKLYEMIWKRTLASQMTPAKYDTVAVDLAVGGDGNVFRATGQTLVFPGFMTVYLEGLDDSEEEGDSRLPPLTEGETLPIDRLYGEQHFTQPPPRYSEASLVKALEEYGIGRPSTYAAIISTLLAREYVLLDKKRFVPTDVGLVVNKFLTEHFGQYVDYDFTAKLEDRLDVISTGKTEWIPVLREFWEGFSRQVEEKEAVSRKDVTQEQLDEACPKCGKPLSIRLGKRGRFVGCSGYPECDYTRNLDGSSGDAPPANQEIGKHPATGQSMLLCNGPYGPYMQLGEVEEGKKPKRVALPKNLLPTQVTPEIAAKLLDLPRTLGVHPESGKNVVVNIGRFGPYIQHDGEFRSVPKADNVFDIELVRALEVLAQPKAAGRGALRQLGTDPADNQPITVHSGRYGPYVKHGKTNATLPADVTPDTVTLEQALELLAAKSRKGGGAKAAKGDAAEPRKTRKAASTAGKAAAPKSRKAAADTADTAPKTKKSAAAGTKEKKTTTPGGEKMKKAA